MHRLAALLLIVGCSSPSSKRAIALGEPPSAVYAPGAAVQMVRDGYTVDIDPVLGTARSMRGTGPAGDVVGFLQHNRDLFGTDEFVGFHDGTYTDGKLGTMMLKQTHRGLPVIGAHLGLALSHGNITLAHGETHRIDIDTTPAVARDAALETVRDGLAKPRAGDRDDARLVVLPVRTARAVRYHLAWEVSAWRGDVQAVVYVDARGGDVITAYDATRYEHGDLFTYAGIATNHVDERTVGDSVVPLPAAHLMLRTAQGATAVTDDDGAFRFRRTTSGPLFVSANLNGRYVRVQNLAGDNATFVGVMRAESQNELEWTETRSLPEERDVFRGASTTNRFVSTVYPGLPWLDHAVLAKVNHNRSCNAFWNGSSINFFVAGGGCNNSGRIFDVIAHEWGHGFDQNAPGEAIDGGLGEFIGDLMSFIQTKSPLLGPNFFTNGGYVRSMVDPKFRCYDSKIRQVHAAGNVLGTVVWDIMNDLERAGVTGERLKRIMLRPIALAQTRFEWYAGMLAVDDDDGNLANGTPNECLIYKQFVAHSCGGERWPGIPDRDPPGCATE